MNVKQDAACPANDLVQLHPIRVRRIIGPPGRRTLFSRPFHSFQGGARCARPPPPPMPSRRSILPCSAAPGQFSSTAHARHCIQNPYIAPPAGGRNHGPAAAGEARKPIPLTGIGRIRGAAPPSTQNPDLGKGRLRGKYERASWVLQPVIPLNKSGSSFDLGRTAPRAAHLSVGE